jgi:hypothetical protein
LLVNTDFSLLDVSDLVLIDAPGAGLHPPHERDDYSVAASVTDPQTDTMPPATSVATPQMVPAKVAQSPGWVQPGAHVRTPDVVRMHALGSPRKLPPF